MSAAASFALAQCRGILSMDSSQERFRWAGMGRKERTAWLNRAGVNCSLFLRGRDWQQLPEWAREKLRAVA